jgi:hypothetical protein
MRHYNTSIIPFEVGAAVVVKVEFQDGLSTVWNHILIRIL